jgi:deoxyribodipyrimidine photo-lyase
LLHVCARWRFVLCYATTSCQTCLQVFWGGTLFHVDDLPFKLAAMPPNYSDFRQALRSRDVRQPVEAPAQLKGLPAAA